MRVFLILAMIFSISLYAEVKKKNYSSGELKSETAYASGKKEGLSKGYYRDGKVKYEAIYKKGKREGLTKSYYKTGTLKAEENYKNGSLNGMSKHFYKSGKLKSDFVFEDDLPVSGAKYSEDGKKVEE